MPIDEGVVPPKDEDGYQPPTGQPITDQLFNRLTIEEEEVANTDHSSSSYKPTRKWVAALVAGVASIIGSWIVTEQFDDVERGMTATLLVSLATSYIRSNEDTPGGVPVSR